MTPTSTIGQLTWYVARAGGFTAYILLAVSVVLGLVLSLQWRDREWPRFVTNALHTYLTLLALVFIVVHTVAVTLDPFMKFTLPEVLVPMASHYRPAWIALGVVAAYLALALWITQWLRPLIGYRWWRRLHYLTFLAFVLATVHGIASGSDTRSTFAVLVYGLSTAAVVMLLALRLLLPTASHPARPLVAQLGGLALAVALLLAWRGPFQPGWNTIANNGHGSGARVAEVAPPPPPAFPASFTANFSGTVDQQPADANGDIALTIGGQLSGGMNGTMQMSLRAVVGRRGATLDGTKLVLTLANPSASCQGGVTSIAGSNMTAECVAPGGQLVNLQMTLGADQSGAASGSITATSAS